MISSYYTVGRHTCHCPVQALSKRWAIPDIEYAEYSRRTAIQILNTKRTIRLLRYFLRADPNRAQVVIDTKATEGKKYSGESEIEDATEKRNQEA